MLITIKSTFSHWLVMGLMLLGYLPAWTQSEHEEYYLDQFDFAHNPHFSVAQNLLTTDRGLESIRIDQPTVVESTPQSLHQKPGEHFVALAPEINWSYPEGSMLRVQVRFGFANGDWASWEELTTCYPDIKGPNTWVGRMLTAPEGATRYQYSLFFFQNSDQFPFIAIHRLKMHVISLMDFPQPTALPRKRTRTLSSSSCDSIAPYIGREAWRAPDAAAHHPSGCSSPQYAPITHLVVHHSTTENQSPNWAATVLALWYYDNKVLERCDIGYNWLIDPEGNLYEGHRGGYQAIGDHLCLSSQSTVGICMLGTYDDQSPTPQALSSLRNLASWHVCNAQLDLNQSTPWVVAPHLELPRIFTTELLSCSQACPPTKLTQLLPSLIDVVGVEDLVSSAPITIFPNPSAGDFRVSFHGSYTQTATLSVWNLRGRMVHQQAWPLLPGENVCALSLRGVSTGLYVVKLQTQQGVAVQRVLIDK